MKIISEKYAINQKKILLWEARNEARRLREALGKVTATINRLQGEIDEDEREWWYGNGKVKFLAEKKERKKAVRKKRKETASTEALKATPLFQNLPAELQEKVLKNWR